MEHQQSCQEISRVVPEEGVTLKASLLINRDGKNYVMSVATPTYLEGVRQYNQGFPEEEQLDDSAFPLDPIPDTNEELCAQIAKVPTDILRDYLAEQTV